MDNIETTQPHLHYRETPLLLRNLGGKKFTDVSSTSGSPFAERWVGRGLAVADLNNDGRLDVVVASNNGPVRILLNEGPAKNHWISFDLEGVKSNRDAIGANIKITTPAGSQSATVTTAGSYQSSSARRVHFGVGGERIVRQIEIRWPSGMVQTLANVTADQNVKVRETANSPKQ